jgi:hypothetical protein
LDATRTSNFLRNRPYFVFAVRSVMDGNYWWRI